RPALREGRTEYFHPVWFSLVLGGTFLAWSGWSGVRPEWTVGAWIPAWMAAVGATTEILRRGSRGSLRLFKVLTLVLLLGVVQTAVLLNVRLWRKLDVKTLPKTDPAASVLGWRALGGRVGRSLSDMGEGTLLLTDNRGTAAELSFYAKAVYRPKVRVVRAEGSPLGLPETAAGREAILVMVGEWTEPPETVRPLFRSWEREDLFRVRRRKSGVIRSVTLFRLYGYAGPPSGENSGSGEAL
ncbi:MAG: hypothetical protein ACE5IM_12740, partial [Nitrospinota bacterium]